MGITVDSREASKHKSIVQFLQDCKIEVKVEALPFGDYLIEGNRNFLVERKTINDLLHSWTSGRIFEQLKGLKAAENVEPLVLIETSPRIPCKRGKWKEPAVAAIMNSLLLNWKMPYIYCFDSETRLLTKRGLLPVASLSKEDLVLTLNSETLRAEYQTPTSIVVSPYMGPMIRLNGQRTDLLVTPQHRLFCKTRRDSRYKFLTANHCHMIARSRNSPLWLDMSPIVSTFVADKVPAKFMLPTVKERTRASIKISEMPTALWFSFFGWWLAEGCARHHKRGWYTNISQSTTSPFYNEVKQLFMSIGYHFEIRGSAKNQFRIASKWLALYLMRFGGSHTKFIPQWVKDAPRECLELLLDSYLKGDGHWYNEHNNSANTVSKRLAEDICEVAIKCGYLAWFKLTKYGKYHIHLLRNTEILSMKTDITIENYNGVVGCVTVPNGVVLVERNGKFTWSGNSPNFKWSGTNILDLHKLANESSDKRLRVKFNKIPKDPNDLTLYLLGGLPNIGTVYGQRLLEKFGSVQAIANATVEELGTVSGISVNRANFIWLIFRHRYHKKGE